MGPYSGSSLARFVRVGAVATGITYGFVVSGVWSLVRLLCFFSLLLRRGLFWLGKNGIALSLVLFSSLSFTRACIFSKDADLSRNNRSLSASIFFLGETIAEAGKEALNRNNKFHT